MIFLGKQLACYLRGLAAGQDEGETPHWFTLGQLIGGTSAGDDPLLITAPGAEINLFILAELQPGQFNGDWFSVFLTRISLTVPQSSHLYS